MDIILNQYAPIVKINNSTILTSLGKQWKDTNVAADETEVVNEGAVVVLTELLVLHPANAQP